MRPEIIRSHKMRFEYFPGPYDPCGFHFDVCAGGSMHIKALRSSGLDATSNYAAGLRNTAADRDHMRWAVETGRLLVTRDTDFRGLVHQPEFRDEHCGVLIVRRWPPREYSRRLVQALRQFARRFEHPLVGPEPDDVQTLSGNDIANILLGAAIGGVAAMLLFFALN